MKRLKQRKVAKHPVTLALHRFCDSLFAAMFKGGQLYP